MNMNQVINDLVKESWLSSWHEVASDYNSQIYGSHAKLHNTLDGAEIGFFNGQYWTLIGNQEEMFWTREAAIEHIWQCWSSRNLV